MIRLVLFDIDGTLIASGGAGVRAFAAVARHTFQQPDGTARLNFAGRTDLSIIREFFDGCGIPATPANLQRFLDDYVHWLAHYLGQLPGRLLPGVTDALESLRRLPEPPVLALLTGNIRLGAEIKLRHFGVWEEFVLGAFSDDHEDRNVLAAIARERGSEWLGTPVAGDEVMVIGDTPRDIACAQAIQAKCLAVATGGTSLAALREHGPTWAVPDLTTVDFAALCRAPG